MRSGFYHKREDLQTAAFKYFPRTHYTLHNVLVNVNDPKIVLSNR